MGFSWGGRGSGESSGIHRRLEQPARYARTLSGCALCVFMEGLFGGDFAGGGGGWGGAAAGVAVADQGVGAFWVAFADLIDGSGGCAGAGKVEAAGAVEAGLAFGGHVAQGAGWFGEAAGSGGDVGVGTGIEFEVDAGQAGGAGDCVVVAVLAAVCQGGAVGAGEFAGAGQVFGAGAIVEVAEFAFFDGAGPGAIALNGGAFGF